MKLFSELLDESVALHGHLCPGQVLGVRMAMAGCLYVGIEEPKDGKNLIVFVEIDRCATDAIQSVTGCKLGKRTLKYLDYGKMAATFLNMKKDVAVRVSARDDARERAREYGPPKATDKEAQTRAYMAMPDDELFAITSVRLHLAPEDRPGHPVSRVSCGKCQEGISDRREVAVPGGVLCRACANGAYYHLTGSGNGSKTKGTPPVLAIVGPSDSGKTRVASAIVESLAGQGYRIAAVKHCPHGHDVDRTGSDTDRLYKSGAVTVIASSPDKQTSVERVGGDASLTSLVSAIGPRADLVVAEGFKASDVPKILVLADSGMAASVENVIATVSADGETLGAPDYTFEEIEKLSALIRERLIEATTSVPGRAP